MGRVIFDPFTGGLSIDDNSGGSSLTPNYYTTFNATTDWGSPSGGLYTLTFTAFFHGKGTHPLVQVLDDLGTHIIIPYTIAVNGNVTLQVSDSPDNRFAGSITIGSTDS